MFPGYIAGCDLRGASATSQFLGTAKESLPSPTPQNFSVAPLPCLRFALLSTGCEGAPLLPLLYVTNNIAFNIAVLSLLKISSAVVASLVVMVSGFSLTLPPLVLSLSHSHI